MTCYNSQYFRVVNEADLSDSEFDDWNEISFRDAELRSVGEEGCIFE